MNDDDLERLLRTQPGRREAGYVPRDLASPTSPRPAVDGNGLLRAGLLVAALVAGALVVAVGAAALAPDSPRGPGIGASSGLPSGTPRETPGTTPTPTPSSAGLCPNGDLILEPEPWTGAAGSRGTVVTVRLEAGASACDLPTTVFAAIQDGTGNALVEGVSNGPGGETIRLEPGSAYTVGISWSNWCGDEPVALRWALRFGDGEWSEMITGSGAEPSAEPAVPVPPCLGDGRPSTLSVRGLEPAL